MNEPDFDDPTHDELRALLADAAGRSTTPTVPAEVAAVLDSTLADLIAERDGSLGVGRPTEPTDETAPVVALRPRRRTGQRLLVAAAAVVLLGAGGVGAAQVLTGSEQSDSVTAGTAAPDGETPLAPAVPEAAAGGSVGEVPGSEGSAKNLDRSDGLLVTSFSSAAFGAEVAEFVGSPAGRTAISDLGTGPRGPAEPPVSGFAADQEAEGYASKDSTPLRSEVQDQSSRPGELSTSSCTAPPLGTDAVVVQVLFEGRPALLVLDPVVNGSRHVAAWSCDGRQLLAETTVASS